MSEKPVANVVIQPAILYIVTVVSIPLLDFLAPLPLTRMSWVPWAGGIAFILAWFFWLWGAVSMRRAGTNILPINPSTALVAVGPFRITRNPLYLALFVTVVALSAIFNTWWGLVVLLPYQLAMHFWVVLREERYLEAQFEDAYREYCRSVRRWI